MRIRTARGPRALAASALALTLGSTLAACGSDDGGSEAGDDPSSTSTPSEPTEASPTATETPSAPETSSTGKPPGTEHTIPLYFVSGTSQGPRLFREFQKVTTDDPLLAGAQALVDGKALDPDYESLLPETTIDKVTLDKAAQTVTVAVSDPAITVKPSSLSDQDALIAAQSLVYTLQGIAGERVAVVVTLNGEPSTLMGVNTAGGLKEAPELDVRSLVNITAPEEGATVSGRFRAEGVASSFEATVPWEIRKGNKVVKSGFSTAEGWIDKLYPWRTRVSLKGLAPGEYVFAVLTDDPSGGEGPGPMADTKTIVVE